MASAPRMRTATLPPGDIVAQFRQSAINLKRAAKTRPKTLKICLADLDLGIEEETQEGFDDETGSHLSL